MATNRESTIDNRQTVLLALCGLSPAVITETVWALAHEETPVRVNRVIALTTKQGRNCIRRELFKSGVWEALRKAVDATSDELIFGDTSDSMRVVPSSDQKRELDDITTVEDSAAVGDFILDNIRQVTENSDRRLIFSLAGGRKTMSALGALCMTLLARQGDRLCHVLVPAPFESPGLQPKFYFPSNQTHSYNESSLKGRDVPVVLHDIPFIRCRDVFRREYGRLPGSFGETVDKANQILALPEVVLRPAEFSCLVDGQPVSLSEAEYAFFWMLCERCWEEMSALDNASIASRTLAEFAQREDIRPAFGAGNGETYFDRMLAPEEDFDPRNPAFVRHLADRIKNKLTQLPGLANPEPLFPSRGKNKGYGLAVPSANIKIMWE
ncbi:MAG: TIGR02584 family CRISPR-associated protein [Candidatus Pacebacteria bacterium]|nr:TIGR02584 family CRISPR-associated protein [Candidatus Paceibacterota bacterium]